MRQEKFICRFDLELSGASPKAVVMARWLPFWIKADVCSHWKKDPQKWEVTLHCQKRWSKVSVSSLQKMQRSLSLIAILCKKEFVGRGLWRNLKWKIIILVLFVHVLVSRNVFFPIYFFLIEVAISVPFCLRSSRFFTLCCNEVSVR